MDHPVFAHLQMLCTEDAGSPAREEDAGEGTVGAVVIVPLPLLLAVVEATATNSANDNRHHTSSNNSMRESNRSNHHVGVLQMYVSSLRTARLLREDLQLHPLELAPLQTTAADRLPPASREPPP